jgi:hypothetical protein
MDTPRSVIPGDCHNVVSSEDEEDGYESDGGKLFVQVHIFISCPKLSYVLILLLRPPKLDMLYTIAYSACIVSIYFGVLAITAVRRTICSHHDTQKPT